MVPESVVSVSDASIGDRADCVDQAIPGLDGKLVEEPAVDVMCGGVTFEIHYVSGAERNAWLPRRRRFLLHC
ncbi:hypothetical protein ABZV91_26160 [Nocardia sp. NPDC004568]|uniref:hypothetical protein n=1 Tax=Nocardia sp. NPDC004568 TaxID=3154551 RepID=UPI00339E9372